MAKLGHEASHLTEEEFLRAYQAREYPKPSLTTDLVIFSIEDCVLKVLLIKRRGHPYQDSWALPGGFLDVPGWEIEAIAQRHQLSLSEGSSVSWPIEVTNLYPSLFQEGPVQWDVDIEAGAHRELQEETSLPARSCFLEQLYTVGNVSRDPRTYVVTVAYYALVPSNLMSLVRPRDDAKEAAWLSVEEAARLPLAFDHQEILQMALTRIRGKLDYFAAIAAGLLPPTFTEYELREVYETIKGVEFRPSSFNRRLKPLTEEGHVVRSGGYRRTGGRPAATYRFSNGS